MRIGHEDIIIQQDRIKVHVIVISARATSVAALCYTLASAYMYVSQRLPMPNQHRTIALDEKLVFSLHSLR